VVTFGMTVEPVKMKATIVDVPDGLIKDVQLIALEKGTPIHGAITRAVREGLQLWIKQNRTA